MLQARCLSTPVYGRSHFKKFWLRKLEKEEELIETLDMSSLSVVSQQQHQQIMSASLNSCDNLKLSDQSPAYSSIPTTGIVRRTPSVANAVKFGSIAPTHVTGSTSGSEISNESLATRMTSFDVVQTSSVDEEAARISLKTVDAEYCAMSRLDENDYHKDCSTIDYTLSLGADKKNGGKIPPCLSRSGSPVLATSGPNQSSKILLQSPGFSSHGNLSSSVGDGDELGKQSLETDLSTTVIYCKSVHLVPSIHDQLQETWKDSFPSTVDETVVQVRENVQLCSAFQSEENSLMRLPVMSTSNQGHVFTACASTSFRSAVTGLHHKMDSAGTDGFTEKILEHRLSLPVLDSAGMWRISGSNPRESSEQNQDASTKLLCSESWNACSPSKESDYNDKSKKTSGCRSKTNLYSRHLSSMNEFPYSLPSPKSRQQLPEGGSTRNLTRTCSHCGTMKTPLWRSGPSGPKSLCNACGIRLKKAGRRIATRDSTDNSVSPPASPKSATKLTSRPLKRKLDKPNSYLVDSRFARARLKASQNHSPKLHLSKKTKIFSAQLRKVQAGEVYCEKAGSINRKTYFSSPSTSPRRTSSACTHETPDTYGVMPAAAFEARKHAIAMAMREVERLETTNPTSLRRSFGKDEEEGAVLLMALSYGLVNA